MRSYISGVLCEMRDIRATADVLIENPSVVVMAYGVTHATDRTGTVMHTDALSRHMSFVASFRKIGPYKHSSPDRKASL